MRHIQRLDHGQQPGIDLAALVPFRNAIAAALLYTRDSVDFAEAWRTVGLGERSVWEEAMLARLDQEFFRRIYVHREEVSDLISLLRLKQMIVVRGSRGCGKTTGLLKALQSIPEGKNSIVLYIDISRYRTASAVERSSEGTHGTPADREREGNTVCDIIYKQLAARAIDDAPDATKDDWLYYKLRNAAAFTSLSQLLSNVERPKTSAQWLELAKSEPYKADHVAAEKTFNREPGTSQLYFLAKFLLDALKVHCTIVLDNIDRLSLRLQQAVVDRAIDLATVLTPVIAVRDSNYHRLEFQATGDRTFLVKAFRADPSPVHEEGRLGDPSTANTDFAWLSRDLYYPAEEADLSADGYLLETFIRKRFKVAIDEYARHVPNVAGFENLARYLGFPSPSALLREHLRVVAQLRGELSRADTIYACLRWHNGSLRTAASDIFNLVNTFVTDRNPFFRYTDNLRRVSARGRVLLPRIRQLRSLTYRHFILGGHDRTKGTTHPLNVLEDSENTSSTQIIRFLRLKLLEYLFARRDGRVTYGARGCPARC